MNPLLRQFTSLDTFLPREVEVRGISYENRFIVALRAQPGQRVELVRDYDNLVDRNAIAVYLSNKEMGYIPREVAQILAPEMDTGTNLDATITARLPKISVRIAQS
ncbi:MAG: HIRAN domain-containing protein [Candidatus Tectomicrobia bacterium]|nr:HIRAN domain-containing protein [Candidatus Tectomicrobia bacterium]